MWYDKSRLEICAIINDKPGDVLISDKETKLFMIEQFFNTIQFSPLK